MLFADREKFNLLVVLEKSQGITNISRIHHQGTMNLCTKLYDDSTKSFLAKSLKNETYQGR